MDNKKSNRQSGQGLQGTGQNHNPQRKQDPIRKDKQSAPSKSAQAEHQASNNAAMNTSNSESKGSKDITNQDAEHRVTNADNSSSPMGEEETEGDRHHLSSLDAYRNKAGESGTTEKKSPSVK
jgi:hypothetical protein